MPNPLLDALGRVAASFQGMPPGAFSGRVWQELKPWMEKLMLSAAPKWLPRLTFGFPCQIPVFKQGVAVGPCQHHAIAACDVCGQPCCLYHARIDHLGDAICYPCVARAVAAHRGGPTPDAAPPPTPAAELAWARKFLKVTAATSWDDVKSAYKKACAKYHPDKQSTDAGRRKAEARFKEIQRAWAILQREHEEKAKAA